MKAIALLSMLAALIIVAVLMLKNLNGKPSSDFQKATGIGASGNITQLPAQVKSKLDADLKRGEENTQKALDEIK